MKYKLGTVIYKGAHHPVVVTDDNIYDISDVIGGLGKTALICAFEHWRESKLKIESALSFSIGTLPVLSREQCDFQAPLLYPAKVICAGANYYDHVEEMGIENIKERMTQPYFFFKPPTTTIVGPGETIDYPVGSSAFDWEVELAAVIGERCKNVSVVNALDVVAAYTVAVDLTARDLQLTAPDLFAMDWYAGKAQDTSCPMGPLLTPTQSIDDPQNLILKLSVNGVEKQNASTSGMVYSTAELISHASKFVTLEPGDLILTGSPAGVGAPRKDWLKRGDTVTAGCTGLATLEFKVRL